MNRLSLSTMTKRRLVIVVWVVMTMLANQAALALVYVLEEPWHLSRIERALLVMVLCLLLGSPVFVICWRLLRPLLPEDPEERANALRFRLWRGRQKERQRR